MGTKQYVTIQGDTWDGIAFRLWGEERHMNRLMAANPDHADVLIFPAGLRLGVPEAPPPATLKTSELPPWM